MPPFEEKPDSQKYKDENEMKSDKSFLTKGWVFVLQRDPYSEFLPRKVSDRILSLERSLALSYNDSISVVETTHLG